MQIPNAIYEPLSEGIVNQMGGEVVIRNGESNGKIYTYNGKIAWVVCDTIRSRLRDALREHTRVSDDDFSSAVLEGRKTGRGFGEVLLERRLIDEIALRRSLLAHNARHFRGLMEWGPSTRALFIPQPRTYSDLLLYTLDELIRACSDRDLHRDDYRRGLMDVLTHTPGGKSAFLIGLETEETVFVDSGLGDAEAGRLRDAVARWTLEWRSFEDTEFCVEAALLSSNEVLMVRRFGPRANWLCGVFAEGFSTPGLALGLGRRALRCFCEESEESA